jgi:hypothetical protein
LQYEFILSCFEWISSKIHKKKGLQIEAFFYEKI